MAQRQAQAKTNRQDIYTEVTERIIAEVESGRLPWTRPRSTTTGASGLPVNATTNARYSGINVLLLWLAASAHGYTQSRWLTYRQAAAVGGQVRRGEKGVSLVYASTYVPQAEQERADACGEEAFGIAFLKRFTVFNVAQIDGLPEAVCGLAPVDPPHATNAALDAFVQATGVEMRFGGNEAYYHPRFDYIQCPPPAAFSSPEAMFGVQAHELAHWTGAEHRLNRTFGKRFGDSAYQMEELVAEISAAQLCAVMGIAPSLRHAAYIQSWLTLMKSDRRAIFTAASQASAAVDYLLKCAGHQERDDSLQTPDLALAA